MQPELCHNNSSDETLAECNEYVSRLRLGSADGARGEENDSWLALGAGMEYSSGHLDTMPTTYNYMHRQAANTAPLDQIRSGKLWKR
jgi:hypothetical protein